MPKNKLLIVDLCLVLKPGRLRPGVEARIARKKHKSLMPKRCVQRLGSVGIRLAIGSVQHPSA